MERTRALYFRIFLRRNIIMLAKSVNMIQPVITTTHVFVSLPENSKMRHYSHIFKYVCQSEAPFEW